MSFFDHLERSGRRRANSAAPQPNLHSTSDSSPKSTSPSASGSSTPTVLKSAPPHALQKKRVAYVLPPQPDPPALPPPPRPMRNPARVVFPPTNLRNGARPSTATGTREEVTPWELAPPPTESQINTGASLSSPTHTSLSTLPHATATAPPVSLSLSDFALVRRSKSTGSNKINKPRPITLLPTSRSHPQPTQPIVSGSSSTILPHQHGDRPTSPPISPTSPKLSHKSLPPISTSISRHNPHPPPIPETPPKSSEQNLRFSTADRTILEELKRNISARKAQFIVKGPVVGQGKKHHLYKKEEVPYPRNYEREVLDLDVWESVFCQQLCQSLTWHVFQTPPTKVLDIGCGTGTWILNCARSWRDCHFVGLDIVPLHPDLQQVGSSELASRITWVQANFLDGLPFPNEEFDFVHIKRIARGVPEDQWDPLLEQITRVMKPGGAFEMIEEDLFFPGRLPCSDNDTVSDERRRSRSESVPTVPEREPRDHSQDTDHDTDHDHEDSFSLETDSAESHRSSDSHDVSSTKPFPLTPPRSGSPLPMRIRDLDMAIAEDDNEDKEEEVTPKLLPQMYSPPPLRPLSMRKSFSAPLHTQPLPKRPLPPQLSLKTPSLSSQHFGLHRPSRPLSQSRLSGSTVSVLSSLDSHLDLAETKSRPRGYSSASSPPVSARPNSAATVVNQPQHHPSPTSPPPSKSPGSQQPFLLRTLQKAPANPRDHALLEMIYTEMHASRFINLAPLSLLANLLGLHFKDVRTHAPLLFSFPPLSAQQHQQPDQSPEDPVSDSDPETSSDSDDARNAIHPIRLPPKRARSRKIKNLGSSAGHMATSPIRSSYYGEEVSEENRWLSMDSLILHASPYASLDDTRMSAFSPSTRASFPSPVGSSFPTRATDSRLTFPSSEIASTVNTQARAAMSQIKNRLPNTTLKLDLMTLNLHLALRTAEVLACAEAMWEWVLEYQDKTQMQKKERQARATERARSRSIELAQLEKSQFSTGDGSSADSCKNGIADLTRDDFDNLLSKFDMDMRDHMALGTSLQDRFSWFVFPSSPTLDRKEFDAACETWTQWEQQQRQRPTSHSYDHSSRSHPSANSNTTSNPLLLEEVFARPYTDSELREPFGVQAPLSRRNDSPSASPRGRPTTAGSRTQVSLASLTAPTRRLSRAMRVFVAWKP